MDRTVSVWARPLLLHARIFLKERSMERKDKVEGEGSYSGSKDYNERTKKFLNSGKVEKAARAAAPTSEEEKHAMQKAERIGRSRAKK
jgi:hypothetical protein